MLCIWSFCRFKDLIPFIKRPAECISLSQLPTRICQQLREGAFEVCHHHCLVYPVHLIFVSEGEGVASHSKGGACGVDGRTKGMMASTSPSPFLPSSSILAAISYPITPQKREARKSQGDLHTRRPCTPTLNTPRKLDL